jgi:homoserine kinase type II
MMPSSKVNNAELSTLEISSAWNLPPIISTRTPPTGTIHQITLLSSNEGSYVLRAYRYAQKDRSRIVTEHALASYVQAHGLPAVAPLSLPSGETILEREGRFYALYPFAEGQQIARSQVISPKIIAAMGRCLGELHQLLASYPSEQVRRQSFVVDQIATVSKIGRLEAAISEKPDFDAFDQDILTMLTQRRTWLTAAHAIDLEVLSSLEQQVLHGDYQESNLFFADQRVSAIIDWDQAYVAPRCWEIIRTLHYVFGMDERCQTFLKAYREVFPLPFKDLDSTAQAYGWVQANNLWAYTSYYLDHNDRVRHLLQTSFTPFEAMWAELADLLR